MGFRDFRLDAGSEWLDGFSTGTVMSSRPRTCPLVQYVSDMESAHSYLVIGHLDDRFLCALIVIRIGKVLVIDATNAPRPAIDTNIMGKAQQTNVPVDVNSVTATMPASRRLRRFSSAS